MVEWVKNVAKRTPLRSMVHTWRRVRDRRLPTQGVKYAIIREYGALRGIRTFVETGTFEGDAVFACLGSFDRIYSVELASELFERASRRFAGETHVEILQGDSASVLPDLLKRVHDPCLFWLDGHFCGGITARGQQDTPIVAELRAILSHRIRGHVVLIDDARLLVARDGYPSLGEVRRVVMTANPQARIVVEHDIVRILLK